MVDLTRILGEERLTEVRYGIGHYSPNHSKDKVILHNPEYELSELTKGKDGVYLFTREQVMRLTQKTLEEAIPFHLRTQSDMGGSFIDMKRSYYELLKSFGVREVHVFGTGFIIKLYEEESETKLTSLRTKLSKVGLI